MFSSNINEVNNLVLLNKIQINSIPEVSPNVQLSKDEHVSSTLIRVTLRCSHPDSRCLWIQNWTLTKPRWTLVDESQQNMFSNVTQASPS